MTQLNSDLKKGRNVTKFIIGSVVVTVFIFSIALLIYEETTKHYREDYENHIRSHYLNENESE